MYDSVQPHRRQLARLPHPWDSPGKNTGVGCHFLLQCMKVKSESEVAQLCLTLSDPMDCSPPGSPSMGFSRQEYWSGLPLQIEICQDVSGKNFPLKLKKKKIVQNRYMSGNFSQHPCLLAHFLPLNCLEIKPVLALLLSL